jgi:hypothetical protein
MEALRPSRCRGVYGVNTLGNSSENGIRIRIRMPGSKGFVIIVIVILIAILL